MSKVELRALGRCGRNRKGDIFTERTDRAKILVGIGKAEYLTRDMSAAPRPQTVINKTEVDLAKSDTPKRSRGRPRKQPIEEPEATIAPAPVDPAPYVASTTADNDGPSSSDYYGFPE